MLFSTDNKEILQQIMMDHYKNPRNKMRVEDERYVKIHMDSASCQDDIYLYVLIEDDKVVDFKWDGVGCVLSTASSSILSELAVGKTVEEANKLIDDFNDFLLSGHSDNEDELSELVCFKYTNNQPSRITCANISFRGLKKALQEKKNER